MTQSVCVRTAEADVELRLPSLLRSRPPVEEKIVIPGPSAQTPEFGSFPSASPLQALAELFIVIGDEVGDYKSHNATRSGA